MSRGIKIVQCADNSKMFILSNYIFDNCKLCIWIFNLCGNLYGSTFAFIINIQIIYTSSFYFVKRYM